MLIDRSKLLIISRAKEGSVEWAAAFRHCVYDGSRGDCDEVAVFYPALLTAQDEVMSVSWM